MEEIVISSSRKQEFIEITVEVEEKIRKSGVKDGICLVYVKHTTSAVTINENTDPNIEKDFLKSMNDLIPAGCWAHDAMDNNGDAHIKAILVGPSETIPIKDGKLVLGTWQGIFFIDFDGPRRGRTVIVECVEK